MKAFPSFLSFIILQIFSHYSQAQLLNIDTNFQIGSAANGIVNKIDIQSNGKIILSGDFQLFNTQSKKRIVRLESNGNIDNTFQSGIGVEGPVRASALQSDDKLIIGGLFNSYNTSTIKNLVRLNSNGTVDSTFNTGIGPNNEITEIFIQRDGKIIISGFFSKYNNVSFIGFVRLNSNGSIDTSFALGTGTNLSPECFAQQSNGSLLIGGAFLRYKGVNVSKLFRTDLNGNLDTTFKAGNIAGTVQEVLTLPNDQVIIAGSFTAINGFFANRIARLFPNGRLDTSFHASVAGRIRDMHLQKDGKIIIAGDFTTVNGVTVQRLARLNPDGTLDNTFYVGTNGSIYDIAEQADKKVMISGAFTQSTQSVMPNTLTTGRVTRIENNYTVVLPCVSATAPLLDTNNITVCKNQATTVSVAGGSLNSGRNWFWYRDSLHGTFVDSGTSVVLNPQTTTTYYVTAGLTCADTVEKFATVTVSVNHHFNTDVTMSSLGMESMDTINKYQWYSCDSMFVAIPGDTNRYFQPNHSGTYAVVLSNAMGCSDTSDCYAFTFVGINSNSSKKLMISNPVQSTLVLPNDIYFTELKIVSTLGQTVLQTKSHSSIIDVSFLPKGLYYLWLKDKDSKVYKEKILVN